MKKSFLFILFIISVATLSAQSWLRKFPIFYQQVNAIAQYGDTLFVGGRFNTVGPNEGMTAIIDSATGNVNTTFPRMYKYSKLVPDGNGGMYVLGDASIQIGGQFRSRLAHVYANGVLSAWSPSPNGIIKELKVYGDKIYVIGNFDTVGGQRRRYIAALDSSSGAATSWNPNIDQSLTTFAVTNNTVYVAGPFTFIAGQVRGVLAAFDATTGAITSWDPSAGTVFTATNPAVTRLEAIGNTIYVGGNFTSVGGQARKSPVAIDGTTGTVTPWTLNLGPSGASAGWVISGNKMYITGDFTSVGGQPRNGLACVDLTTGLPNSWNPGATYPALLFMASSFSISGNTVYISYSRTTDTKFIIAVDAITGALLPWGPPFLDNGYPPLGGVTYATAIAGKVFAYGYFYSVNAKTTPPLVAISATTGDLLNLNYNVHGTVAKLITAGNKLYVIGSFDSIQGQSRRNLAAINLTNGSVTPWNPIPNNTVSDLVVNAGAVYLSGTFTSIGGQVRNYLAAVDTGTGLATSWAPVVNTVGNVLAVNANKLYVGGSFTTIGGQARSSLASFDLSTGTLTAWNPNPNGPVIGFAKNDSSLFVLGGFTNITNQNRNRLAAFDLTTDSLKSFSANIPSPAFPILGLVANNSKVYVFGGTLSSSGMGPAAGAYFVSVDAKTGQTISWNYPITGGYPNSGLAGTTACGVYAAHLSGNTVYVGGIFINVGNYTSASFAVFGDSASPATPVLPPVRFTSFQGQRQTNGSVQLSWQTADENYISGYEIQRSTDSVSFVVRGTVPLNANHSYQFTDQTNDTLNYYRIKAIPTNNNTRYSGVIKLSIQQPQQTINRQTLVFPNPSANSRLQLQIDSLPQGNYNIALYALSSGIRVVQQSVAHVGGRALITADVSSVRAGTYTLIIKDANGNVIIRKTWVKL